MPDTKKVKRPTLSHQQIAEFIAAIEHPRDRALMCIGLFCAVRPSETFGLTWGVYAHDRLLVKDTAYEGTFYEDQVKTDDSRAYVSLPIFVRKSIERWRLECADTRPEALMFPTFRNSRKTGKPVPLSSKNFFKSRIWPGAKRLGIAKKLVTFQVMRRTVGTDLQMYGTL